jgi:hypothetical protein
VIQEITGEYQEVFEKLEDLEQDIQSYQDFLGSVKESFDECSGGCRNRFNGSRVLEAEYIKPDHIELIEDDKFIDSVLEGEITSSEVRKLTDYCRDRIAEMREDRNELIDERRELEKKFGVYRHPKKNFEE